MRAPYQQICRASRQDAGPRRRPSGRTLGRCSVFVSVGIAHAISTIQSRLNVAVSSRVWSRQANHSSLPRLHSVRQHWWPNWFIRTHQPIDVVTYEAVLFDLDGTICHRTGDATAAYRSAFEQLGAEPFGESGDLWGRLDGPPDPDDRIGYIATGFARLAAVHDRDIDPVKLSEAFVDAIDDRAVGFTPGAERALSLAADTAAVGLITNGPRNRQKPKIETLELGDRFDTLVYAGDLDRRKPHTDPFDRALDALNVRPSQAVYVGNSLSYDVAGAFTAGLDSVWLRSSPDREANGYQPDWTLDSLEEFDTVVGGADRPASGSD
ncbi:MAG: haloacid dehalogenase family protein [Halorubrum sp. J07HR59]|nr:MAG: haloacid dehalogenase family protein [Halorubrum sp. J07HR59]